MRLKYLTTGIAAAALVGAAAAGVTSIASAPTTPAVAPMVFGAPLPLDPAADLPTSGQLVSLLNSLADPGVSFRSKGGLVEGGVGIIEGRTADALMKNAAAQGKLPLSFQVANIAPAGPGAATADVTASGPTGSVTQNVTFVDQGGWKLSRGSAMSLLQAASGA
ncbi:MAG: hypothetical protein JO152_07910 [Mycobacteriaceae bacterium]|nr:hypothetical protein [Mycobacteriaceae bacterium]